MNVDCARTKKCVVVYRQSYRISNLYRYRIYQYRFYYCLAFGIFSFTKELIHRIDMMKPVHTSFEQTVQVLGNHKLPYYGELN